MIKKILHQIVAIPFVYDLLQFVVGATIIRERLKKRIDGTSPKALVIDIGGGTGLNRALFDDVRYICLDNDPVKLKGFSQKMVDGEAILGDATQMPIESACVDVVICSFVVHHLPNEVFPKFVQESLRILKPDGKLVVLDAVWLPHRLPSRILWKYDRGSYPRTAQTLHETLSRYGEQTHWEEFAIFHRYIIGIFQKNEAL